MKNLRLFDSHCHLDDRAFKGKLDLFLTRAADAGVRRVLVAACDEHSSFESLKMAGECSGVEIFAAAGVHPHEAKTVASGIPEELMDLSENPKIRAIGECGLDYFRDFSPRPAATARAVAPLPGLRSIAAVARNESVGRRSR